MPLFDYACRICQHEREVRQAFDAEGPTCPQCSVPMTKKPSAPAIHMAGMRRSPARPAQQDFTKPLGGRFGDIPYVTRDGGLADSSGRRLLTSDGKRVP